MHKYQIDVVKDDNPAQLSGGEVKNLSIVLWSILQYHFVLSCQNFFRNMVLTELWAFESLRMRFVSDPGSNATVQLHSGDSGPDRIFPHFRTPSGFRMFAIQFLGALWKRKFSGHRKNVRANIRSPEALMVKHHAPSTKEGHNTTGICSQFCRSCGQKTSSGFSP